MLKSQKLQVEASEIRSRLGTYLEQDDLGDEERSAMDRDTKRLGQLEIELRAALSIEGELETRALESTPDSEMRERLELRSTASLTNYLKGALSGRLPSGAEAELNAAAGIGDGIPLELWDTRAARHGLETRADAATGAPGTVGVNLDAIRPAVFANAVLPMLGVEMPRVESGSYVSATISTSLTAGSQAKGGTQEATAAAFRINSVTPKRITGRLGIRIEDVAAVGQANFEPILRENLALVLSDELDDQGLNGAAGNSGADLNGLFQALTNPTGNAPTEVAGFDAFVASFADGIDGLWAPTVKDIMILCGPDTYKLSAKTFRDATGQDLGDTAFADYAMARYGGWMTNKRMPDAASTIQQAILYRRARGFLNMGEGYMRTAVCATWNEISIDDIYSGSASGERFFTMHVLLSDVIVVQPDAYAQVQFKVSA